MGLLTPLAVKIGSISWMPKLLPQITATDKFVQKAQEIEPDIVAMSALLSITMPAMPETIRALTDAGIRANMKVMIGGAPVTEKYANEIKADSYAPDAASAVIAAKKVLGIS